jgi:hypothetical protein
MMNIHKVSDVARRMLSSSFLVVKYLSSFTSQRY